MGTLRENIDHYMDRKGIETYSRLLFNIARELGLSNEKSYEFADKEKSNFSKMLNGKRPLKHEFILPLEKIFGVSLARLLDEEAYKVPLEKDEVPFDKGFRYYAYLDDPKLYKNEFDLMLTKEGNPILTQTDEFEKTFLDYVVEYHSVNGVRYLHDEYGIKLKWHWDRFEFKKDSGITFMNFTNCIEFARLVADMEDAELFHDIFDTYNMFLAHGHYVDNNTVYCQDDYLEILLDHDDLFHSLFEERVYEYTDLGKRVKRERKIESIRFRSINPIINNCLRYALNHLDHYRRQAKEILKFGIRHNKKFMTNDDADKYCIGSELGGLIEAEKTDYFSCEVVDIAIFVDCEADDEEIQSLIEQLPKFPKKWEM